MAADEVIYQKRTTCALYPGQENCSSCWRKHISVPDHETNLGVFDVMFCSECDVAFTQPFPSEETSLYLYEARSSSDFDVINDSVIDRLKDFLAKRLLFRIAPLPVSKVESLLDFSCGNARFAAIAHEVFPNAEIHAVDFQEQPPKLVASGQYSRLSYHTMDAFPALETKYDLIILRHVLEHTHHPIDLVTKLASKLSQRGILYIEVPNFDSGCSKVLKSKWKAYYVPRHIFHYTAKSLTSIIMAAGLEGKIERNDLPLMGNTLAILFGWNKSSPVVQSLGVLLHPLQLAIERLNNSSTCINVRARLARTGTG